MRHSVVRYIFARLNVGRLSVARLFAATINCHMHLLIVAR